MLLKFNLFEAHELVLCISLINHHEGAFSLRRVGFDSSPSFPRESFSGSFQSNTFLTLFCLMSSPADMHFCVRLLLSEAAVIHLAGQRTLHVPYRHNFTKHTQLEEGQHSQVQQHWMPSKLHLSHHGNTGQADSCHPAILFQTTWKGYRWQSSLLSWWKQGWGTEQPAQSEEEPHLLFSQANHTPSLSDEQHSHPSEGNVGLSIT